MPTFTPPTVKQPAGAGPLLSRYSIDVGQSVVKMNGVFTLTPYPWIGDLEGKTSGVDYFLGGRTYVIDDATAAALEADGFTTAPDLGYGEAAFGSQGYGY